MEKLQSEETAERKNGLCHVPCLNNNIQNEEQKLVRFLGLPSVIIQLAEHLN